MKWTFIIQQKYKVALLFFTILVLIVLTNLIERRNIKVIETSFSSIYNDRLIPAADIFYLTENIYKKRLLLQEHILSNGNTSNAQIHSLLNSYNVKIDSLIKQFEKTYLVNRESECLQNFKNEMERYNKLESLTLASSYTKGVPPFDKDRAITFQRLVKGLEDLTLIQTQVGEELMKDSKGMVYGSTMVSYLELALAVVIGFIIQVLVLTSKIVNQKQKFNLN